MVAVCIKKEFLSLALTDYPITDSQWHSVAISHVYGKRLFGQSQVTVYIDGKERKTAVLKFPLLSEVIVDMIFGIFNPCLYGWGYYHTLCHPKA